MRSTTRAAALAAALFCLLAGALAVVAPTASAAAGDVTVTWPEITTFNADETDYVIDAQWDPDEVGSVWLRYEDGDGSMVSLGQLTQPGTAAVEFPSVDDANGARLIQVFSCPTKLWNKDDCTVAATSPPLTVSRAPVTEVPAPPQFSVAFPTEKWIDPDHTTFAPDVSWDGTGSLFVELAWGHHLPQKSSYQQVWSDGPVAIDFPDDAVNGSVDVFFFACPGRIIDHACSEFLYGPNLQVYDRLDVSVQPQRIGPNKSIGVGIDIPHWDNSVEAHWELSHGGTVVASGDENLPFRYPDQGVTLPALGSQPDLVNEQSYQLQVTVSGDIGYSGSIGSFGQLTGTSPPVDVVWDSQSDEFTVSTTSLDGQGHPVATNTFYPAQDDYRDTITFQAQLGSDAAYPKQITIYDADGHLVTTLPHSPTWDGLDSHGEQVPAGRYSAEVLLMDAAANPTIRQVDVVVRAERVKRVTWRHAIAADSLITRSFHRCGSLESPARPNWPGSLGYYTGNCDDSLSQTIHQVTAPVSVTGRYGMSRVSAFGGKAPGTGRARLHIMYVLDGDFWHSPGSTFGGQLGVHHAAWDYVLTTDGDHHTLTWRTQAREGDRYDVEKFIVQVRYDVLR